VGIQQSLKARQLLPVALVLLLLTGGGCYLLVRHRAIPAQSVALGSGRPQLIDFGMGLCAQCKRMRPVMEQASRELGSVADVHTLDVRQEDNMRLAERFKMRLIPLVVLTDGAGNVVWRHEGYIDFPELAKAVHQRLGQSGEK
jgi:thioredoxin-like negative regulator of GroEL